MRARVRISYLNGEMAMEYMPRYDNDDNNSEPVI